MRSAASGGRATRPLVLLGRPLDDDFAPDPALEKVLASCEVLVLGDDEPRRDRDVLERVEIAVTGFEREAPRASLPFAEMKQLALVHSLIAGIEDLLDVGLADRNVVLTNSAGCYANGIAEYVLSIVVGLLRGLPPLFLASKRAEWREQPLGRELASSRLGIVGYGGIGRRVGELARSVGAEVWAVTRRAAVHSAVGQYGVATASGIPSASAPASSGQGEPLEARQAGGVRVSGLSDLHDLLGWSDIVVLATSLNPGSRGLLGRAELARLAEGAFLVNVSRGEVLDEAALVDALSSGSLGGAVLDTTAVEPLPPDHALWQLENVWITPHMAGGTREGRSRVVELLAYNLHCYLEGRQSELRNVIDFALELSGPPRVG